MSRLGGRWQNWGRSVHVRPRRVEFPRTVDAVRRSVTSAVRAGLPVKAVGSGHSFTGIAAASGLLLDLRDLTGLVGVDAERGRATLRAGTRLHDIPALLAPYGLAMENLGDIDHQTLAGAVSTGTHGTGAGFRGLAAQIVGVTLVTADGGILTVDDTHEPDLLPAVALSLGALGVAVEITLQCVPAFVIHAVDRPAPLAQTLEDIGTRAASADHFEMYWFPHTDRAMTKTGTRLPGDTPRQPLPVVGRLLDEEVLSNGLFRVSCALGTSLPGVILPVARLATRLTGDREYTDASHRVFVQHRGVRFREMEYALPQDRVADGVRAVRELIVRRGWRISFPVEVRFAAADDLWLSTASGRDSAYIAVHRYWREDPTEYFAAVEEIMRGLGGRPHWGKMHTQTAASLRTDYAHFDDFLRVRDRLDPDRVFANAYLRRVLGE